MDVRELRQRIAGEVIERESADYEARRRAMVWNRLVPASRPLAIARVRAAADVIAAVRFAREHGLRVAIRGGGHQWSGACLSDETLLLDLAALDAIEIDAESRTARVQPGVENGALARRLGAHGLAFPFGHCPTVKMSGYLLSGGLGWNPGMWGPACASVTAVDVVTADGRAVTADASHQPELFWAARGGGAGFCGVVTRFHLRAHALPRCIRTSTLIYPLGRIGEVADWAEALAPQLVPSVELGMFIAAAPPDLAAACAADKGRACLLMVTAFADSEAEAAAALAPIDSQAPAAALAHVPAQDTPFEALFEGVGQLYVLDHRWLVDTFVIATPAREILPAFARLFVEAPSTGSVAVTAIGVPAVEEGALSLPAGALVFPYACWENAADDGVNRAWFEKVVALLEPHAAGHYVGEADLRRPGRAERCYKPAAWRRLADLRRRYDPDGLFAGFPA